MNKRIMLVDDHSLVRSGIKQVLNKHKNFEVIAEAINGIDALNQMKTITVDIVILDLSMPKMNGMDLLQTIKKEYPKIKILVLSMHDEFHYVQQAIKKGADGYVTKGCDIKNLINVLKEVSLNRKIISPQLEEKISIIPDLTKSQTEKLSSREYEVLEHLGNGKTATEISNQLEISIKTVSTYRTRILQKLNLHSTADLILYYLNSK